MGGRRRKFGPEQPVDPVAVALAQRINAELRAERKARREAGWRETYNFSPPEYYPPHTGLKRGPKPDPNRECTEKVLTVRVTKREAQELRRHHRRLCKEASPSTFLRYVLCQFLQAHKDPDDASYSFNPDALDYRTRKWKKPA